MKLGIEIDGAIYANDGSDIEVNIFLDKFIEFVEANGWHFGGGTKQIDEDGEPVAKKE